MRPLDLGRAIIARVALATLLVASACSRSPAASVQPPSTDVAFAVPTHAQATTTTSAKLQLDTAIEVEIDSGATEPPSLSGKVVLHVGDSMVGGSLGLTKALEARFTREGATFLRDYKVSESILSYDKSLKLKELLAKHQPDIVIVTLGTNDVFVPFPSALAQNVKSIVARIGARECYWIGPPTWKPDTGIVQVLRDNVAPCRFYDSSNLKLQRAGDGIHPTDRGGADWARSFWTFFRPTSTRPLDAP
jgi:hypothetical protein